MNIRFTSQLPTVGEVTHPKWDEAEAMVVSTYWSGEEAPIGRHFEARSLWNESGLAIRFVANQDEPLVINSSPDLSVKTMELWERDVCEIFIAPDSTLPERYFEFEVAPTGEWIDLGVHRLADRRETDWSYQSGMSAFGAIEDLSVKMAIHIPWSAFGSTPRIGTIWKGNIFRCVGSGESRGYLAWKPTFTSKPDFHVPNAFGDMIFHG